MSRYRRGFSIKIHVLAEVNGQPLTIHLTTGQAADMASAPDLIDGADAMASESLADKVYDSDEPRSRFYLRGGHLIVPCQSNRKNPGTLDRKH